MQKRCSDRQNAILESGASWGERLVEPVFISIKLFSEYPLTQSGFGTSLAQSVAHQIHTLILLKNERHHYIP
jgi:hypothetical protein